MARHDSLQQVAPIAVAEDASEREPLLRGANGQENGGLESQSAQHERHVGSEQGDELSTKQVLAVQITLWPCLFLTALDTTIVATLSGPISATFNSFTLFSWLASAYLIANAAVQPLSGKLTDIYGRKAGFGLAMLFFGIGTTMCGLATTEWVIIAGRLVAGAGGGCVNTISTFIVSDMIPTRQRGVWHGIGNLVFGVGMGVGGLFGGFINDRFGWKWAFLIQVPLIVVFGLLGYLMINIPVKEANKSKIKRVDFLGSFCLSASLILLLLGLDSGGNIVPWNHPLVYVSLPLSGGFLAAFIYVEDKIASEPVIPVRLLKQRSLLAACLTNWWMTSAVFAVLYYGPIYFQVVGGMTSTGAGLRLIPLSVGAALGSLGSGMVMRATGKYWWLNFWMQINSVFSAALILCFFDGDTPEMLPFVLLFTGGVGYGAMLTITLIALISGADHEYQAVVTSASYAFRATGSTIGISVASAVLQNLLTSSLYKRFGDFEGAAEQIRRIRDSVDEVKQLPEGWYEGTIEAYVGALRGVWVVVLGFAGLSAAVSLLMREHPLHSNLARK